jgi:hypothetical protein
VAANIESPVPWGSTASKIGPGEPDLERNGIAVDRDRRCGRTRHEQVPRPGLVQPSCAVQHLRVAIAGGIALQDELLVAEPKRLHAVVEGSCER